MTGRWISKSRWEEFGGAFNDADRIFLREAVIGQTICPPGWSIDEDLLPHDLRVKLDSALGDKQPDEVGR
jgi:hypothetical protein